MLFRSLKGGVALIGRLARVLVAMATIAAVMALLYKIGPTRSQTWRQVWPGAVLTTLLWLVVTTAFGWYLRNLGEYNVMYGGVAGVIAMLVWMYLLALITLIGCEYNAERERLLKWVSA